MTIKVKQHYRNVNGKLVLVHEHEHKGNAAQQHEPEQHASWDDFDQITAHHFPEAEADYASKTADEFDSILGGYEAQTGNEFDSIVGLDQYQGDDEPEQAAAPEPKKESAPPTAAELEGIGGSPWEKPEKGISRIYFNGLHKLYLEAGGDQSVPYEVFKGAKLWFDNKDGQFHSKNMDETLSKGLAEHLTKKAKEWGSNNAFTMPDGMTQQIQQEQAVDGPKVGDTNIAFDQLKTGMEFKLTDGKTDSVWKITDVYNGEVMVQKLSGAGANGVSNPVDKGQWEAGYQGALMLTSKGEPVPKQERGSGTKIGETPKFEQLKPGMVIKKPGATNIVIAASDDTVWAQSLNGVVHEYSKASWEKHAASQGLKYEGMDDGSEKVEISPGMKVGDTKTINGVTYRLNENHRWEKVDGEQLGTKDKLEALSHYWGSNATSINGVSVKRNSEYLYLVMKNDENGKPLSKKVKDALNELHPTNYGKKKGYFIVRKEDLDKLSAIIDGKVETKPKAKPAPKAGPVAMPQGFPFKKIGEQKGSNPGGLYEDKFGKKWYIKFPQSEDHVKNELLASKLYTMAGIAAPKLKIVNDGGKVGIASAFVEGLTNDGAALKAGAPGAKDGFGVDAWLANWDSAGLSFDNMPVDKDGKAVRIDVGGSLLYRAQGGPKGDAFGNTVSEIDSLRDPGVNAQTAAIFGSMTPDELNKSIAGVLVIPDSAIEAAVMKWGPGDDAAKKALAKKLIARKDYLAKRFPDADRIANPPAPDPTKLPIDESKLPAKVDFFNYQNTGKPLSSKEWKNAANQKAFDDLYAYAMKGDLIGMKGYKYKVIDKDTGEETGKRALITEGHPNKDISAFYSQACAYMEAIAYPSNKKVEGWLPEDVEDIASLSEAFPGHPFGTTVGDVPKEKRLGYWISLGDVSEPELFKPTAENNASIALHAQGKKDYSKMPSELRSWLSSVQGSGSSNIGGKHSSSMDHQKKIVAMAYQHATEIPEGTKLRRWEKMPADMRAILNTAPIGHIYENPRSTCTSMNPLWEENGSGFGGGSDGVFLELVHAKGAKGLATFGSGSFYKKDNSSGDEQEITSLPGQRYMLLEKGKASNGKPKYKVLVLPPDPTYMADLGISPYAEAVA